MTQRILHVVPYNPAWAMQFKTEKSALEFAVGDAAIRVHHIGSTSVPGLAAKPIIDILVECSSLEKVDDKNQALAALGYEAKGENGIKGRRFFIKGGAQRSHHVHVFLAGSKDIVRHLAFRDFLIAHPKKAETYGQLKQAAIALANNEPERYMAYKNDFIKVTEIEALQWQATRS